jgi:hypothetical protein
VILDVMHHYRGAFSWTELWERMSGREIERIHDRATHQARADQHGIALLTTILAKHPYVGGMKDVEVEDMYTGLARVGLVQAPYSRSVMRGVDVAAALERRLGRVVLSQAHVDLLGNRDLVRYWRNTRERDRVSESKEALGALRGLRRERS